MTEGRQLDGGVLNLGLTHMLVGAAMRGVPDKITAYFPSELAAKEAQKFMGGTLYEVSRYKSVIRANFKGDRT